MNGWLELLNDICITMKRRGLDTSTIPTRYPCPSEVAVQELEELLAEALGSCEVNQDGEPSAEFCEIDELIGQVMTYNNR